MKSCCAEDSAGEGSDSEESEDEESDGEESGNDSDDPECSPALPELDGREVAGPNTIQGVRSLTSLQNMHCVT